MQGQLETKRTLSITMYDQQGRPGTVPVWFAFQDGKLYIYTVRDSRKAKKIALNPRVTLRLGDRRVPSFEGTASFATEEASLLQGAAALHEKYRGYWGLVVNMVQRFRREETPFCWRLPWTKPREGLA